MIFDSVFSNSKLRIPGDQVYRSNNSKHNQPISISELLSWATDDKSALLTVLSTSQAGHAFVQDAISVLADNTILEIQGPEAPTEETLQYHTWKIFETTNELRNMDTNALFSRPPANFIHHIKTLECHPDILLTTDLEDHLPNLQTVRLAIDCTHHYETYHAFLDFMLRTPYGMRQYDRIWTDLRLETSEWKDKARRLVELADDHGFTIAPARNLSGGHCWAEQPTVMVYYQEDAGGICRRFEIYYDLRGSKGKVISKQFSRLGELLYADEGFIGVSKDEVGPWDARFSGEMGADDGEEVGGQEADEQTRDRSLGPDAELDAKWEQRRWQEREEARRQREDMDPMRGYHVQAE